jgi:hypothetical protein
VEKREFLSTVGGSINFYSHNGKQDGGYSNIKNKTAIRFISPTGNEIHVSKRYLHTFFIATLFIIAKIADTINIYSRMNKENGIYWEYYLPIERRQ